MGAFVRASIIGLGMAVPEHRISRQGALDYAATLSCQSPRQQKRLRAVYGRTGVDRRGSVLLSTNGDGQLHQDFFPPAEDAEDRGPTTAERGRQFQRYAGHLADRASRQAFDDIDCQPGQVTHLITVTCTGFHAPGIDIELIDALGLPVTTQRVQLGFMGCHGAINALRVARGLLAGEPDATVLVCCVELCSLHYQYGYDANRIVSGAIFADGAAAMLLQGSDEDGFADVAATGSCLVAESREAMTWKIGNHGFEMTLSAAVPELIERHLQPFLEPWLVHQGVDLSMIGGWAVHPGGTRILTAVQAALGLDDGQLRHSREVLAQHGNMSSATLPMVLQRFAEAGVPRPWLMLGFGPGLEIEVAFLR